MNTISTAYEAWATDVNTPPLPSIDEAVVILQSFGPTLTNQEGLDWWNALAADYGRLGIIPQSTYVALRNLVNQSGTQASLDLFNGLITSVNSLPESAPVNDAIDRENDVLNLAAVPGNITTIEGNKTGGTNQQLDAAYDAGIFELEGLAANLTEKLNR